MIDGFILFFSILSLLSLAGAVGVGLILVGGRSDGPLAGARQTLVRDFGAVALPLAAAVATTATLGSLFMSEVAGFIPCRLCWVQRGFMYPLAVLLIFGSIRPIATVARWVVPWATAGGMVSAFHYAEQRHWIGGSESLCSAGVPCTDIWVWEFGFVTIPFMALTGFAFIVVLMQVHTAWTARHTPSLHDARS